MGDLAQITYEVKLLASQITDLGDIARHINSVHGAKFQARDIEKLIAGKTPGASIPRQNPSKAKLAAPIAWNPPISTNRGGTDLLAVATNAYIEKYRDRIEALAR